MYYSQTCSHFERVTDTWQKSSKKHSSELVVIPSASKYWVSRVHLPFFSYFTKKKKKHITQRFLHTWKAPWKNMDLHCSKLAKYIHRYRYVSVYIHMYIYIYIATYGRYISTIIPTASGASSFNKPISVWLLTSFTCWATTFYF